MIKKHKMLNKPTKCLQLKINHKDKNAIYKSHTQINIYKWPTKVHSSKVIQTESISIFLVKKIIIMHRKWEIFFFFTTL